MIQRIEAKEGHWLWNHTEPIGSWDFCKSLEYDDKFPWNKDLPERWTEITDAEKVAKEEEQEEWRRRQEPDTPEDQVQEG